MASSTAAKASASGSSCGPAWSPADSTRRSHQRSPSPSPAAAARAPSGSRAASESSRPSSSSGIASWKDWGRSMKRTVAPAAWAKRRATHSGEKDAKGKKAARPGSSRACTSRATGGSMPAAEAK